MKNLEDYKNQIELLKQALLFYANPDNYNQNQPINEELTSLIELDEGSQARFALEQLKKVEKMNQKMEEDYKRVMDETISAIEDNPIDLTSMVKTIKNIDNNIKNQDDGQ